MTVQRKPIVMKLSAFERYMLIDDRPSHPMTCHFPLRFSGDFDPEAFVTAVGLTLERHPMLASRLEEVEGALRWVADTSAQPPIDFGLIGEPLRFTGAEAIDLRRETGLRIWVRTGENHTLIQLQIHHACTDGAGAFRFIEDLLCAYHDLAQQENVEPDAIRWRPVDPSRLEKRASLGMTRWGKLRRLPADLWGFFYGFSIFMLLRPATLAVPKLPEPGGLEELELVPEFVTLSFDEKQLKGLITAARQSRGTLTDLFLRDIFLAMDDWNRRHGGTTWNRCLRIMVPSDLRGADDQHMPACNVIGMYNLDRFMWMFRNPRLLMTSVRLEMKILKFFRFGIAFVRAAAILTRWKWWTSVMRRPNRCFTTTVVSNVGRLFLSAPLPRREGKLVCGNMVLDEIQCAPPIRPLTFAGFALSTYAGRCTLMMNYDRRRWTRATAEDFMEVVSGRLHANLQPVPPQGTTTCPSDIRPVPSTGTRQSV